MVADLFSKNERPRALGIYAIGTYLGVFLGYFIGGYVNQHYGWRMAFFGAGVPGLVLAAVLWLTVSEPRRGAMAETFSPEPLRPTLAFLASQRTFVTILLGFCLTSYTNYATSAWIPPFLARVHHLSSAEIGTYAGTFKGLFGMAGTLVGGLVNGDAVKPGLQAGFTVEALHAAKDLKKHLLGGVGRVGRIAQDAVDKAINRLMVVCNQPGVSLL